MFSEHYNAKETEKSMQEFWDNEKIYKFVPDGREIYSIDTPPPTVSGSLHIGHIFSYTQAEIIARFQRMQGKNVFYPFGFDDNGLPTERLVEKEAKTSAFMLPRSEFNALCRKTTYKYVEEFKSLWKSLGFSVDWSLQYETIGELSQKISQRSFIKLARSGRAYQKETPVLWCTNCRTSIAQAELDSAEKESNFSYVVFRVDGEELIVATTRPELLYGCVTLFVNPDDERYSSFIGKTATVPLYDYDIPIIADDKVEREKGTGVVMCATFGDTTDLEWYQSHSLPYKKVIEPDGRINESVPFTGGLKIADARAKTVTLLEEHGLLKKSEKISHTVSVHERCGREVEIILSKQWFIELLSQKERFLAAADEINWYHPMMKTRYRLWVENLKWDWCISRQRYFGVPFPVWYCKKCGRPVFAEEAQLPVNPLETMPAAPCGCGCGEFLPETAVLDTWATSSVSTLINARSGEPDERGILPMSMRTQAHEIIRTWAFYSIVRSIYETGRIPWKDIMICGFVLAKKGEKISKSKGNEAVSPKELVEGYSADILRYWAANAHLGTDTMFSQEELKISARFITKLWNAAKFTMGRLENFNCKKPAKLMPLDLWMLERCNETQGRAAENLSRYEPGAARHEIDELFWKDYCDNYLEAVKDRLYNPQLHGENEHQSAMYTLYHSFLTIIKMYAIFVPHITELIYQSYYRGREGEISIHLARWIYSHNNDALLLDCGNALKQVLSDIRKYKSERNRSVKSELETVCINTPTEYVEFFRQTEKDIKSCCSCKNLIIKQGETLSAVIEEY